MKKFILGFITGGILAAAVTGFAVDAWQSINVLPNTIKVIVDGKEVQADNFLYNDTTYLPIRAVSEALKMNVQYDSATSTAVISSADTPTIAPTTNPDLSPLPEVPVRTVYGVDYVHKSDIETMLQSIGLEKFKLAGHFFYDDNDKANPLISDVPLCENDILLIPLDYYNSTLVPFINSLR